MTSSTGDEELAAEATRVFEESGGVISLRGFYYQLVKDEVLLNLDDEWDRLVRAIQGSPLVMSFKWKPLQPGERWREPDLS